jgi:hypothetical protein
VGLELRLPIEAAEALERNLPMFASMIRQRVCFARGGDAATEPLLAGLERLTGELKQRMEPFDAADDR